MKLSNLSKDPLTHIASTHRTNRAKLHLVPKHIEKHADSASDEMCLDEDEYAELIGKLLMEYGYKLVRGDIVMTSECKFIYDGKITIQMDQYGFGTCNKQLTIPSEFSVISEFPIYYWSDILKVPVVNVSLNKIGIQAKKEDVRDGVFPFIYEGVEYYVIDCCGSYRNVKDFVDDLNNSVVFNWVLFPDNIPHKYKKDTERFMQISDLEGI